MVVVVVVVVASSLSLSFSSGACNEVGGPVTAWYNTNRRTLSSSDRNTYLYICIYIRVLRDVRLPDEGSERVVKLEGLRFSGRAPRKPTRERDGAGERGEGSRELYGDHGSIYPPSSTLGPSLMSSPSAERSAPES